MQKGRPTMADVARAAKVSPSTAARVILGSGYASKENKERVLSAVETLGYRPNLQARSLRHQRSFTLGLVLSSACENPFFTKLSEAIFTTARAAGYSVLSISHGYSEDQEIEGVRQFLAHRVEALVMCHAFNSANYLPLVENDTPIIQIEREVVPNTHLVRIDPRPGLEEAISALVAKGHRRIAFLGGRDVANDRLGATTAAERLRAETFRALVIELGLNANDCPMILGDYKKPAGSDRLSGYTLVEHLFDSNAVPRVTAIVAGSDLLAAGVLQTLYDRGIRVPADFSIVGYDDSLAGFLSPPMTSIGQPYEPIATAVLDIVTSVQTGGGLMQREVNTKLIERRSIASAPEE